MWENNVVWWIRFWCGNEEIWVVLLPYSREYSRSEAKTLHSFVSAPSLSLVSSDCEYLWAVNCCLHTEASGLYCGQTLSANTRVLYSLRVLMLYCTRSCISSGFRKKTALCIICRVKS